MATKRINNPRTNRQPESLGEKQMKQVKRMGTKKRFPDKETYQLVDVGNYDESGYIKYGDRLKKDRRITDYKIAKNKWGLFEMWVR